MDVSAQAAQKAQGLIRQSRRDTATAVRRFADVIGRCDVSGMMPAWLNLDSEFALAQALRAVSRLESVHPKMRERFLGFWIKHGDAIRCSVNDDLILIDALRKLLPPYEGPGLTLYRGDSAFNRRRRTYGISWTRDKGIARDFAMGIWQTFEGGSVLLAVDAPAPAIIARDGGRDDGEQEYLVDRRRLKGILAIERFAQRPTQQ